MLTVGIVGVMKFSELVGVKEGELKMLIKDFLRDTTEKYDGIDMLKIRPLVVCKDGFHMSVQASRLHYCTPRKDIESGDYNEVEIGLPSEEESLIIEYAECPSEPTGSVYGYVPIETVDAVIEKHGGISTHSFI